MASKKKLREQLMWAWDQLGCRCVFDKETKKKINDDPHCPLHGIYTPDNYWDVPLHQRLTDATLVLAADRDLEGVLKRIDDFRDAISQIERGERK